MRGRVGLAALAWLLVFLWPAASARPQTRPGPGEAQRPNILLITLDTTRADHLGCYGMGAAKTPVLDGLASKGALFEEAHAHVPLTLPSHAVILTGQLPSTLNLRVNGLKLKEGTATLATHLKAMGYWTGAVVSSVILEKDRGLARGFDEYDDRMTLAPSGGGAPEERRAAEVTEAALEIAKKAKGPYFLWAHYYDPHYDYRPPEPYAREFSKNPYDGEIAYMDAAIGALVEGLGKQGKLGNTVIVVAGDHGEGLMEHGERQHGVFIYEYAMHVPLLIVWEGHVKPGLRVKELCGLADVAPTVLDLLGAGGLRPDGVSLRSLLDGGKQPARPVYIESYHGYFNYGWAPLRGTMTERMKFIEAPRPELYEWKTSEEKNLYRPDSPDVVAARKDLKRFAPADEVELAKMESLLKDPSNAETLRQLQSLGYLSGGGARPDSPGLLDPKDSIGIEEDLRRAKEEMDMGGVQKGIETLLSVLKRNPLNVPALSMLGLAYLNSNQLEKAKVCFLEEIRLKPQMETGHLNLGTTYKRMGQKELAEKEYRAALTLSPRMPEAAANLAQMLLDQKRPQEARQVLETTLAAGGGSAEVYFELGVLEATSSNWDKARFAFTKSVSLDPRRHEAYANLGRIAYQQNRVDEAIYQYERALRIAPKSSTYLATLGSLYLSGKNDQAKALQYFQRALAADPYGPDANNLREIVRGLQQGGAN